MLILKLLETEEDLADQPLPNARMDVPDKSEPDERPSEQFIILAEGKNKQKYYKGR